MTPITFMQIKKAAKSAEQARKAAAETMNTAESMAKSAEKISERIENLQADAAESVISKKVIELQAMMLNNQISSDKKFLDSSNQLQTLIEALKIRPDAASVGSETLVERDPEMVVERLEISHVVERAERKGGIPGYQRERESSPVVRTS